MTKKCKEKRIKEQKIVWVDEIESHGSYIGALKYFYNSYAKIAFTAIHT